MTINRFNLIGFKGEISIKSIQNDFKMPLCISDYSDKVLNWYFRDKKGRQLLEFVKTLHNF